MLLLAVNFDQTIQSHYYGVSCMCSNFLGTKYSHSGHDHRSAPFFLGTSYAKPYPLLRYWLAMEASRPAHARHMESNAARAAAAAAGEGVGDHDDDGEEEEEEKWREALAAAWGQSRAKREAIRARYAAVKDMIRGKCAVAVARRLLRLSLCFYFEFLLIFV